VPLELSYDCFKDNVLPLICLKAELHEATLIDRFKAGLVEICLIEYQSSSVCQAFLRFSNLNVIFAQYLVLGKVCGDFRGS
jgi:hypothetical protein